MYRPNRGGGHIPDFVGTFYYLTKIGDFLVNVMIFACFVEIYFVFSKSEKTIVFCFFVGRPLKIVN